MLLLLVLDFLVASCDRLSLLHWNGLALYCMTQHNSGGPPGRVGGRWLILVSCLSCWTWTVLAASLIRIFFRESTATSMAGPFTRTLQLNPLDVTINQSLYVKHRVAKVIRTGDIAWVHSMMLTLLPGDYLWYDALTRHGATSEPIIIQPTTIRGLQPPRQNIVSYSESGSGGVGGDVINHQVFPLCSLSLCPGSRFRTTSTRMITSI